MVRGLLSAQPQRADLGKVVRFSDPETIHYYPGTMAEARRKRGYGTSSTSTVTTSSHSATTGPKLDQEAEE